MSKKSEMSRTKEHTTMPAHKDNHPSKLGESGTNETPNAKSHEQDIEWGEGMNGLHPAHKLVKVKDAKHVMGTTETSRNHQVRRENGGADPCGDCE